jgi:hypothetical protein
MENSTTTNRPIWTIFNRFDRLYRGILTEPADARLTTPTQVTHPHGSDGDLDATTA